MRRRPDAAWLPFAGALLGVWLILPLVPPMIWSFAHGWRYPDLLPREWSVKAWIYALSGTSGVLHSLGITTLIALAVTALAALIGLPAGRALGLHRFRGKGLVELLILAPLIVPGIAVAMGLHAVFTALGLTGTVAGVILVHLIPALPYMTLVMAAVFATHDTAYEDQARSLGAGPLAVFRHVTLPVILPGLLTASALTFLVSWGQYALTLMIGSGKIMTLPLLLFSFAASGRNDISGAIAVIYVLPGILFLALTAGRLTGRGLSLAGPRR
jgi:putative spermidine/putrescine transport system permease protein